MNIPELLKDSAYKLTQFKPAQIAALGHDIPEEVIRRRFASGQANLARYCALVDDWDIYDNSGPTPVLISERTS